MVCVSVDKNYYVLMSPDQIFRCYLFVLDLSICLSTFIYKLSTLSAILICTWSGVYIFYACTLGQVLSNDNHLFLIVTLTFNLRRPPSRGLAFHRHTLFCQKFLFVTEILLVIEYVNFMLLGSVSVNS